jgi:hypothetical protein
MDETTEQLCERLERAYLAILNQSAHGNLIPAEVFEEAATWIGVRDALDRS